MKKWILLILLTMMLTAFSACQGPQEIINAPEAPVVAPADATANTETPQETLKEGFTAGKKAIDVKLTSLDGESFVLSENLGKVVVLNFWASWCPPCKEEIPYFNQAYEALQGTDALIVGINLIDSDTLEDVETMIKELKMAYPIYLDTGSVAASAYRVRNIPTTVIVDPQGVIYDVHVGGLTKDQLLQLIEDAKK